MILNQPRNTPQAVVGIARVEQWATLPLAAWPLSWETVYTFGMDDYLIEPDALA